MSSAHPFSPAEPRDHVLDACFLGPYGENDTLLEKLLVEFLRDHVYWRRNFHPEDPPAIGTAAARDPDYLAFESRMRRELHQLSAALKRSVPFHSPRFLGHMVSDLLLPGLAAQTLTLPYNPNNVSEDAAPVTVDMEAQAGLQLARMLGYPHDPAQPACAFGHLTSGGTLANYQALRLALSLKAFPLALRAVQVPDLALPPDDWAAFNLAPGDGIALLEAWQARRAGANGAGALAEAGGTRAHRAARNRRVLRRTPGADGTAGAGTDHRALFLEQGREAARPRPRPAGTRGDPWHAPRPRCPARDAGALCARTAGRVAVRRGAGQHRVRDSRSGRRDTGRARAGSRRGAGFRGTRGCRLGWLSRALFRNEDGTLRTREEVAEGFAGFPTPAVYRAFAALAGTDSITVDPHKLGYLPYGSGSFLCRVHRALALLAERADYLFHAPSADNCPARYRSLGQFIPEGSKPGASAAAVYVTHRTLPLDHAHFGRLPRATVRAAEAFHAQARRFALELDGSVRVLVPFVPDTNLVCLALNPEGNARVGRVNAFVRSLHDELRSDPRQPLQTREFFGSVTGLRPELLGEAEMRRILDALGLDRASFDADVDRLLILRHTLMNPYLIDRENGISYIERYFAWLGRRARALVANGFG